MSIRMGYAASITCVLRFVIAIGIGAFTYNVSLARTIFVAPSGDGTDGESWTTAYQSIGSAILGAVTDDEIWLKKGTYFENLTSRVPLTLLGGFEGKEGLNDSSLRDPVSNVTTIDGNHLDRVFTIRHNTVLDGVVLTNGIRDGAGIWIRNASIELRDVVFANNGTEDDSSEGGGIYADKSSVTISDCIIRGGETSSRGGGIFIRNSNVEINRTQVINNRTVYFGAGAVIVSSTKRIEGCLFERNFASAPTGNGQLGISTAGGLHIGSGPGVIKNCIFRDNGATFGGTFSLFIHGVLNDCA